MSKKKKNQVQCGHCGNYITVPGEPALPRLKDATKKEIARIGDPDLEAILTFDKEYSARNMVEGFIFSIARAVNKYKDSWSADVIIKELEKNR